jgi:hypothetical protein
MSDYYADTLEEIRARLQRGIDAGKLAGVVNTIYIGPQPESKFENDSLPVIIMLDGGFREQDHSAAASQTGAEYTIILRLLIKIFQNVKESGNTLYAKGGLLPMVLPADVAEGGLIYIRSKIIDTVFTDTNGNAKGQINSGVRSVTVDGDGPILDGDKFYQDIRLTVHTGLFGINGRNYD